MRYPHILKTTFAINVLISGVNFMKEEAFLALTKSVLNLRFTVLVNNLVKIFVLVAVNKTPKSILSTRLEDFWMIRTDRTSQSSQVFQETVMSYTAAAIRKWTL